MRKHLFLLYILLVCTLVIMISLMIRLLNLTEVTPQQQAWNDIPYHIELPEEISQMQEGDYIGGVVKNDTLFIY